VAARAIHGATLALLIGVGVGAPAASAAADRPIYVRPGAPGEPTQRISVASVTVPVTAPYSHHEVHFLQHMMVHHGQAVTMSALVPDRASDPRIHTIARQIDLTQDAEIAQMAGWLEMRDEEVPDPFDTEGHENMPGMVSHEDMMALEASEGAEFDVLFLELMIQHHAGAIIMVEELNAAAGVYVEPNVAVMAYHFVDQQETEIKRMQRMLDELNAGA
jgi:uncharacterized protein (DUF305 family)